MVEKQPSEFPEGVGLSQYYQARMAHEQLQLIRAEEQLWAEIFEEAEHAYAQEISQNLVTGDLIAITGLSSREWITDKGWFSSRQHFADKECTFGRLLEPHQRYVWPLSKIKNAIFVPTQFMVEVAVDDVGFLFPIHSTEMHSRTEGEM